MALRLGDRYLDSTNNEIEYSTRSILIGATTGANGSVPSPHKFIALPNGTIGPKVANPWMGQIFMRGIASTTTFDVRLRYAWEITPFPSSPISPFITESPRLDSLALESYSRLLLEVEFDAYDAEANFMEWVGNAIRKVAPYVMAAGKGALSGLAAGPKGALVGALGGLASEIAGGGKRQRPETVEEVRWVPRT